MQMEKREEDRSFVRGEKEENWLPICQSVKDPTKKETLFLPVADGSKKGKNKK